MSEMDLIPGDYRQRIARRRLLRKLVMACLLVLFGVGVARTLLAYLIWQEKAEVVRLERQESISQQNQAKAETYRQRKLMVEKQLAALDELRGRDRVALFLRAIDAAYSEGIWFDSLHFLRRSGTGSLSNVPGAANSGIIVVPGGPQAAAQALDIAPGVDIVGHALSHSVLADFMRKLGAQPTVADLRLIDTSLHSYTNAPVVNFTISLQLHQTASTQP